MWKKHTATFTVPTNTHSTMAIFCPIKEFPLVLFIWTIVHIAKCVEHHSHCFASIAYTIAIELHNKIIKIYKQFKQRKMKTILPVSCRVLRALRHFHLDRTFKPVTGCCMIFSL